MTDLNQELKKKLTWLEDWFGKRKGSIVAFSGGIDSSLVLFLARKFQGYNNSIGVISNSESLKNKDLKLAQTFCEKFDIQLKVIKTLELTDPKYNQNPIDRCFFCKDHLFQDLNQIQKNDYPEFDILSGTNFNDLGDYRPGIDAAKKNQILSPLVDCEISKDELRLIAKHFELPNWDKPASPCLSSRIPYNQPVTIEKLKQIEAAEDILNGFGFEDVRVRHFGNLGKIEVKKEDLNKLYKVQNKIIKNIIDDVGFQEIEIDAEGLVSGKLNRVIKTNKKNEL